MPLLEFVVSVILFFFSKFCTCSDSIKSNQFINDPEAIISSGTIFKLGFFSPVNTTKRYVGIVYISASTAIWVANRERPLNDSIGSVTISEDGNLVILDGQKKIIWSSNVTNSVPNSSAQILDSGNLVLRDNSNGRILWESFKHPVDSCLQDMRLGTNIKTNERQILTSWKSASDPSVGKYSAGLVPLNIPQFVIWNGDDVHWRSGPWNGQIFIGIPGMYSVYLDGFHLVDDREGGFTLSFTYANETLKTYYLLNAEGTLVEKSWVGWKQGWEDTWLSQTSQCDTYGKCGSFGTCDSRRSPVCTCLHGFEPRSSEEWGKGNWSGGCMRRVQLKCDRNNSSSEERREDGFLRLRKVKVPDFAEWSNAFLEEDCRSECLSNCSCTGYAFYNGFGCMKWKGSLIDIQKFNGSGVDIYVRMAFSELDKKRNLKVVIAVTVAIGSVIVAVCIFFSWKWLTKKKGSKPTNELLGEANPEYSNEIERRAKLAELPLFTFRNLESATKKFHPSNMLGQGGFGPVYRGKLPDGQEIAVKRLSRSSGQGQEEFMNEVVVISKLQHRNLVRILGCCIECEEKILIYEYMPNRSLDAHLFESPGKEHLTWSTRVNIIEGIGRGLMYLHRDSRLRIIHRDLKASNILLDNDLNPKISDFGMARIFGGNQDQANTGRIVGTFGYMAPEYAMEGRFSEKSDVYSFGVLLLEIVSGRRNTSFYHDEVNLSLLGFVWNLWSEKKMEELIEPRISESCSQKDILRYAHVGLLCVQDLAKDRPSVPMTLSMLSSEIVDLPTPKQPIFTQCQMSSGTDSLQSQHPLSVNDLTFTTFEGR